MNARYALFAWRVALTAFGGCATPPPPTSALLTYETQPGGATLYEAGQVIGVAPVTRTYTGNGSTQPIRTPLVTAVWPSGAKESFYTLLPLGADRIATIERPVAAPGLEADREHAKKVVLAGEQEARRRKEALLRDQRRNSERCRAQQAGTSLAVQDDC